MNHPKTLTKIVCGNLRPKAEVRYIQFRVKKRTFTGEVLSDTLDY